MKLHRPGYSLIELVAALLSATILVAALAATLVVSLELVNDLPDERQAWEDRAIADRLASDFRYATAVTETGSGFQITKPEASTGAPQTIRVEPSVDGLTRQVDSGTPTVLDPDAPTVSSQIAEYLAESQPAATDVVRLVSSSFAESEGPVANLTLEVPPGCAAGDLLVLAIAARTPDQMVLTEPPWQGVSSIGIDDLRMLTAIRSYEASMSDSITISVTPASGIAAAIIALENVDSSVPVPWATVDAGLAWSFLSSTHPTPLETTNYSSGQLNLQVFAADRGPWHPGTMGVASFADVVIATSGGGSNTCSVGIVMRTGATPSTGIHPPGLALAVGTLAANRAAGGSQPMKRLPFREGVTLIEIMMSMVLITTVLLVSLNASATLLRNQAAAQSGLDAHVLAGQILDEISSLDFVDRTDPVFGLEVGEFAADRRTFDDVDDFHGYVADPATYRDGTVISEFQAWSFSVTVTPAAPSGDGLTTTTDTAAPLRLATVTCTAPDGTQAEYRGVISNVPSDLGAEHSFQRLRQLKLEFPNRELILTVPHRNHPDAS